MTDHCDLCDNEVDAGGVEPGSDWSGAGGDRDATFCCAGCRDVASTLGLPEREAPGGGHVGAGRPGDVDDGRESRDADGAATASITSDDAASASGVDRGFLRVDGMHSATDSR